MPVTFEQAEREYLEPPDDHECDECENWRRRGDELFDQLDQANKLLDHKEDAFDDLADRLRERDDEILRLTKLLIEHNVCAEIKE